MVYNESNFAYLKSTSLEKYYNELVKAEYICEYCPKITKMIIRKVAEAIVKSIGEKHNIESNVAVWKLIDNIRESSNFSFPDEIHNAIELVLVNGYEHASYYNRNKKISRHPIEVLENIHEILCWYLKNIELKKNLSIEELNFKAPSTIEYQEKEIKMIKEDISLKDNQIRNLRQKLMEVESSLDDIRKLNEIIIGIKEEKIELENIEKLLSEKLKSQKYIVAEVEKNYSLYIKKFEHLEESCKEIQELIFNTESRLVKAEIQKQDLKTLIGELEEKDDIIIKTEQSLNEELHGLREVYENLIKLSIEYEDILETIEFSYDNELHKILESKINNLTMKISFEDRIFNENILDYGKNIGDAKRKIRNFKEILNERIKKEMKYEPFYTGFLRLEGKELRIIYAICNSVSTLISKSKDLMLKASEDRFLELINKNLIELKNINDNEIKLIFYYRLVKLCQNTSGRINNRREFIHTLDNIVDKAYEVLMDKKDFKGRINKLDAINSYYLGKSIVYLKNKDVDLKISDELAEDIYNNVIAAKEIPENLDKIKPYYDKLDLNNMSEKAFKSFIKAHPFEILLIMVEFEVGRNYEIIAQVIFEVEKVIVQKPALKIYGEDALGKNFFKKYFTIVIFLVKGGINYKQQKEILPLLVNFIVIIKLMFSKEYEDDLESYNNLVELWKHKQEKYNDIFVQKEDKESELEGLIKEKNKLEENCTALSNSYEEACKSYENYTEEFKQIVMNSEKRVLLPSYMKYDDIRIKKEAAENHLNKAKDKIGTFKRLLSPEVWVDQASKLINESNMMDLEKALIEEAKQKLYFQKDYEVFAQRKEKVNEAAELLEKEKEKIKQKEIEINQAKIKIDEFNQLLSNMKNAYLDIEEGYY
ncbi:hypothetical protein [Clostridium sp. C2-6-12]|uniref:hypothetical protein n=1 Tax=Clostridium sp. C2-6-12 TaxID=2698832 RepID=UPI00136EB66A|nr:hypothetical protein [Clostridium sp. C2-6-12]